MFETLWDHHDGSFVSWACFAAEVFFIKIRIMLPKDIGFVTNDGRYHCLQIQWHHVLSDEWLWSSALRKLVALQFKPAKEEKKKIPQVMEDLANAVV